ncbi:hypothetical protein EFR01_26450 [Sinorhizobium fredii]|nr:hypothetical protein EFR01_26450 [Sinorhizobium fredii]GLS09774.1 hypothetical protein GCM10007864_34050 [Sinorhizobium fredii]
MRAQGVPLETVVRPWREENAATDHRSAQRERKTMRKLIRAIAALVRDTMDILTFRKPSRRG